VFLFYLFAVPLSGMPLLSLDLIRHLLHAVFLSELEPRVGIVLPSLPTPALTLPKLGPFGELSKLYLPSEFYQIVKILLVATLSSAPYFSGLSVHIVPSNSFFYFQSYPPAFPFGPSRFSGGLSVKTPNLPVHLTSRPFLFVFCLGLPV